MLTIAELSHDSIVVICIAAVGIAVCAAFAVMVYAYNKSSGGGYRK